MSIIEYAERIFDVKLYPFQKRFLEELETRPANSLLVSTPKRWMLIMKEKGEIRCEIKSLP